MIAEVACINSGDSGGCEVVKPQFQLINLQLVGTLVKTATWCVPTLGGLNLHHFSKKMVLCRAHYPSMKTDNGIVGEMCPWYPQVNHIHHLNQWIPWKWPTIKYWLVVWNMNFIFPYIGNVIIPTDEIIFFGGVGIPPTRLITIIKHD